MAVHGNSCAGLLPHANAHILKAARHQRRELTCLQISLAWIQTFIYPFLPPSPPSAPHYEPYGAIFLDGCSPPAGCAALPLPERAVATELVSVQAEFGNVGINLSAPPTESPMAHSGRLKLAVLNYVNCIFLAQSEIKHGRAAAGTISPAAKSRGAPVPWWNPGAEMGLLRGERVAPGAVGRPHRIRSELCRLLSGPSPQRA